MVFGIRKKRLTTKQAIEKVEDDFRRSQLFQKEKKRFERQQELKRIRAGLRRPALKRKERKKAIRKHARAIEGLALGFFSGRR